MRVFNTAEPVEEISLDPSTYDFEIGSAIRLIQKNERGRQGRGRYLDALQKLNTLKKTTENTQRLRNGKLQQQTKQEAEDQAAETIQNHIRGILARKKIEGIRDEEMIFLGMKRKPRPQTAMPGKRTDPLIEM